MNDAAPDIGANTILDGRYRLVSLLGEGGMGRVFAAEDLRLGRRVAIKVVAEAADDRMLGERLFREARAAARSDHPAVVTAFGYGSDPDLSVDYFVMERLIGETVGDRIQRVGPLPLDLLLRIALETCDALVAVHDAGVIHRDLKPNNLFLASRGPRADELKLLDFGVAKQLSLQTITTTGQIWGTPVYMAPEQLSDSKRVDARCDLYGLGAVMYECLTGQPPFAASNLIALAFKVVQEVAPDAGALRSDAPPALLEIVARCLRKDPQERFQHARHLQRALQGVAI
ncbi:MAG TPA: serine/threonine-protein kinase [Polyangiales bacterium]|nr:serine/threonine-protein kinase [Polyangiales bacterium]